MTLIPTSPQCDPSSPPHAWLPPWGPPHSISQKPRCLLGSGVSYSLGFLQWIRLIASQPGGGFLCLLCCEKVQFSLDFPLQGAESCAETWAMLPTSAPETW